MSRLNIQCSAEPYKNHACVVPWLRFTEQRGRCHLPRFENILTPDMTITCYFTKSHAAALQTNDGCPSIPSVQVMAITLSNANSDNSCSSHGTPLAFALFGHLSYTLLVSNVKPQSHALLHSSHIHLPYYTYCWQSHPPADASRYDNLTHNDSFNQILLPYQISTLCKFVSRRHLRLPNSKKPKPCFLICVIMLHQRH